MTKMTHERQAFKPFKYPWMYEAWLEHEQAHWLHTELPFHDDVIDFQKKLPEDKKRFLTHLFRFFTMSDIDVAGAYVKNYLPVFPQPETRMMLLGFAARECFDKDTEVLTNNGWKFFKDLCSTDLVAQANLYSRELTFSKPLDYVSRHYTGVMHYYKNTRTDICVTPNHRLFLINPHSRQPQLKESVQGKWGRNFLYPVNCLS